MSNAELMRRAISDGLDDDKTTAAALDAIREESGCTLLVAVLEVARVWHVQRTARSIARAAKLLRPRSSLRAALMAVITTECPGADEDRPAVVTVLSGHLWPHLLEGPIPAHLAGRIIQHIGVGAEWVIDRGSTILDNHAREARARRGNRSK